MQKYIRALRYAPHNEIKRSKQPFQSILEQEIRRKFRVEDKKVPALLHRHLAISKTPGSKKHIRALGENNTTLLQ